MLTAILTSSLKSPNSSTFYQLDVSTYYILLAETVDSSFQTLVYLEFVSGFVGDALVAGCLCYFLHRSRTGFEKFVTLHLPSAKMQTRPLTTGQIL